MTDKAASAPKRPILSRIGPSLIAACVVIGPGSILTSTTVGSVHGYGMAWVVLVAVCFMLVYMTLAARLGVSTTESTGRLVAKHAGRPLSVLIGLCVFFISATFQFGNNLGAYSAISVYVDADWLILLLNALALAFLYAFQNLYKALERLMMFFVGLMLVSFAANLLYARPNPLEVLAGFVPRPAAMADISLLGLVGTTFVITIAYFQTYLVRQRGWTRADLPDGMLDVRVGASVMAAITLMIMITAGTVLRGAALSDVKDVAVQLEPLFGRFGQALFCLGLFSAAYSSFVINSMIGGFILSDSLGLGADPAQRWPKLLTSAVLLTGMGVAFYVIGTGARPVGAIVAAQAVTVIAAPLMAGTLLWLVNRKDVMGDARPSVRMNVAAGLGFVLLVAMAWYTASTKVWPAVADWMK